jgi:DNA-binding transcriptional ArsR family regulator
MLEIESPDRLFEESSGQLHIDLSGVDTETTQQLIDALSDEDCRQLLAAADSPMTARELIDACDIPRATVYRKLKRLEEADLLETSYRLRSGGLPPTQYERNVDQLLLQTGESTGE